MGMVPCCGRYLDMVIETEFAGDVDLEENNLENRFGI